MQKIESSKGFRVFLYVLPGRWVSSVIKQIIWFLQKEKRIWVHGAASLLCEGKAGVADDEEKASRPRKCCPGSDSGGGPSSDDVGRVRVRIAATGRPVHAQVRCQ